MVLFSLLVNLFNVSNARSRKRLLLKSSCRWSCDPVTREPRPTESRSPYRQGAEPALGGNIGYFRLTLTNCMPVGNKPVWWPLSTHVMWVDKRSSISQTFYFRSYDCSAYSVIIREYSPPFTRIPTLSDRTYWCIDFQNSATNLLWHFYVCLLNFYIHTIYVVFLHFLLVTLILTHLLVYRFLVWITIIYLMVFMLRTFSSSIRRHLSYIIKGLSRVNGVRRSSAKTWNFNPSPKSQLYFNRFKNLAWMITLGKSIALPNLVMIQ